MADVLSIHIRIWNIETCHSHFKKRSERRGRLKEGRNQTGVQYMHYMELSQ
jgi:hypothetical protein